MGIMAVKLKAMPSSPDTDLKEMKEKIKKLLESEGADNLRFETEDVAFSLKSLIITFGWPEDKELEETKNKLKEVKEMGSLETVDLRRAIG